MNKKSTLTFEFNCPHCKERAAMQLTPMNIEKLKKASRLGGKKADKILDTLTIKVGFMKENAEVKK